jgi:hypothetical protein
VHGEAGTGRLRRHVRRAQNAVGAAQVRGEPGLAPGPVAEGDHVGAGRQEPVGEFRRDPAPGGGVLAVDDAEVGCQLGPEGGQSGLDGSAAGRTEDVGDEENPQRAYFLAERQRRRRVDLDDDVVPGVVRVPGEGLALGA